MSFILSTSTANPPYVINQSETMAFARDLFRDDFINIDKLLRVFENGFIKQRFFSAPLEWFKEKRRFSEKNDKYCEMALKLSVESAIRCLTNNHQLIRKIKPKEIDAIIFVSTTGLSTPSIDAKIMNELDFDLGTVRIPIWGLGCAGGAAGIARAHDYCKAHPEAAVLVIAVELCSLTFQYNDRSKSNLVGVSLFADGAACALIVGEQSPLIQATNKKALPKIQASQSALLKNSLDVMGWDVRDEGLYVVFAKSIPSLVTKWFKPTTEKFLNKFNMEVDDITHFIAHPGGRKVLEAYEDNFKLSSKVLEDSWVVLENYGNMSSPTVLFVLDRVMAKDNNVGDKGIAASLGPGFSAELVLMEWEAVV